MNENPELQRQLKRLSPEQLRRLQQTAKTRLLELELEEAIKQQRADFGASIARVANGER